jgi:hypothetical protein
LKSIITGNRWHARIADYSFLPIISLTQKLGVKLFALFFCRTLGTTPRTTFYFCHNFSTPPDHFCKVAAASLLRQSEKQRNI